MKVIKVELPYFDRIEVFPIADLHVGDECTDEKAIASTIDYILAEPNRFVILAGDLMNTALKNSKSDIYSAKYSMDEELNVTARILKPLADAKRILAMTPGNHEDRVFKETGLDVGSWLAEKLGVLDRYSNNSFVLFVRFGKSVNWTTTRNKKNVYSFYVRHGSSAGGKSGNKLNKVMQMSDIIDCDINIMGHVHDGLVKSSVRFKCDIQNMTLSEQKIDYLITNAWQSFSGYGLKLGFTPTSKEVSYVILNGNGPKKTILVNGIIDSDWKTS